MYLNKHRAHISVPHSHSFYQLLWFQSDQGSHHVDFKTHSIIPGRVFLIAKNQVHFFEKDTLQKGVIMHFNESFLLHNETDIELFIQYGLFNSETPYVQLSPDTKATIMALKGEIDKELTHRSEFGHRLITSLLLRTILIQLERSNRKSNLSAQKHNQLSTFLNFRAALEIGFKSEKTVLDYANELHVSSKTLTTYCKTETGKPTSQLIIDRRILEAKRLLLHTESLVNQVGYTLGFGDPSYFVKLFKKQVGMTPMQFRKSISE
ncbi:MAG: helix-turn-helix domain-containing protein [Saprospiraceae bacterium]